MDNCSPLLSKTGNQLSSWDDMWYMELSSSCCTEINIHRLEIGVSGNLCSFLKDVKPLVLYDVEHGTAMDLITGKWTSSRVYLSYTELFSIPEVIAVFLSSCDSGLGDSLLFHPGHSGSLRV